VPGARGRELGCRELEGGSSRAGRQVEMVGDGTAPGRRAQREGAKKRPGNGPGRVLEVWCGLGQDAGLDLDLDGGVGQCGLDHAFDSAVELEALE